VTLELGYLALQRPDLGERRAELIVPIGWGGWRRAPIGLGAELLTLGPEPIELGPELFHLRTVPLDPHLLLPLELRDRRAEPIGFGRGVFSLDSEALALGDGSLEVRIAVADQRRVPIGHGACGQQVGLPALLTLEGRALEGRALLARGRKLTLEPIDLAPQPIGLTSQPIDLAPQGGPLFGHRPHLARRNLAQRVTDRSEVAFETIAFRPDPIPLGQEFVPFDPELVIHRAELDTLCTGLSP
jgi:hypothetical protein